ncbi:MAG TPA: hypothetical protein VIH59_02805 [Candidatus Tectomicrobia bacterium]
MGQSLAERAALSHFLKALAPDWHLPPAMRQHADPSINRRSALGGGAMPSTVTASPRARVGAVPEHLGLDNRD